MVYDREEYAKKDFWNDRFRESKGFFDWYAKWEQIKPQFEKSFSPEQYQHSPILMVGCGNSRLSEDMYKDGYQQITNMDISDVVLEKMRSVYFPDKCPTFQYVPMDATNMQFRDNSFDFAFDKGTYDALACGQSQEVLRNLVREMVRVSSKAAIIISSGTPAKRLQPLLDFTNNEHKIEYFELQLSRLSNLINILRTELKDKPLSYALKQKDVLKNALLQIIEAEQKVEESKDPRKKLLRLMMKAKAKKQREDIEKAFGGSTDQTLPSQDTLTDFKGNDNVQQEITVDQNDKKVDSQYVEIADIPADQDEQKVIQENSNSQKSYDPKRQEFVMMYIIYK
eukprot:403347204